MTDIKISQLPPGATPLAGTEAVPIVQTGVTVQVPASAFGPTLPVAVTSGGTGLATVTQGDLLYASSLDTLTSLAKNTSATRYLSNTGSSNNPAWAQVNLANGVTGTLPIANGGTGQTSANNALNALLPTQTANSGKFLQTDGSNTSWQTTGGGGGGGRTILTLNPAPGSDANGYNICNASISAATLTATDVLHIYAAGYISFTSSGNVDVDLDLSLNSAAIFPAIRIGVNVGVSNGTNSAFYFEAYCPAAVPGQSNGFMFFDTFNVNTFPSPNEACQKVLNAPAVTPLVFYGLQDGPFATDLTQAFNARLQLRTVAGTTPPSLGQVFHGTSYIEVLSS